MTHPMPPGDVMDVLRRGCVIPASPLALDEDGQFDRVHQRAVYHYYSDAGAGGIAVGVHTTQFEIRDPSIGLFEPVLTYAAQCMDALDAGRERRLVRIAGVCGPTAQATSEAKLASGLGYHAGLLSLAALKQASISELVDHCHEVAESIPLVGFYLQPSVGGRLLPLEFWREFVRIPNVVAIKIAPFNRYQTIDVIRAVALEGRADDITLYTGNDDTIIHDLMTPFPVMTPGGQQLLRFRGGLLGQWSAWTRSMVTLLEEIHRWVDDPTPELTRDLMAKAADLTDANAAVFDARNQFAGCIPGINEVLRARGLLATNRCLNPHEVLSPGQREEIERVAREHPWLEDAAYITENIHRWLKP